jgi:hypothetical protein
MKNRRTPMIYEVRYIVDGEEFTEVVDVETAAEAADTVKQHHPNPGDSFELIQVQLMEEVSEMDSGDVSVER